MKVVILLSLLQILNISCIGSTTSMGGEDKKSSKYIEESVIIIKPFDFHQNLRNLEDLRTFSTYEKAMTSIGRLQNAYSFDTWKNESVNPLRSPINRIEISLEELEKSHEVSLFQYQHTGPNQSGTGILIEMLEPMEDKEEIDEELLMRKTILEYMVRKHLRSYEQVSQLVLDYFSDPQGVYRKAKVS